MKRKLLVLAIVVIITLSCVMLVGCGNTNVKNQLSYGVKYLNENYLRNSNMEAYYIFNKNGTGEYHYHSYGSNTTSYTIGFKYFIDIDSEVVYCFYDSFEYGDDNNATYDYKDTHWTAVLNFTDKFLYSISSTYPHFYVTEQFLSDTITNFG